MLCGTPIWLLLLVVHCLVRCFILFLTSPICVFPLLSMLFDASCHCSSVHAFRSAVISVYVLLSAVSPTGCRRFLLSNICVLFEYRFTQVRCQVALTVSFSSDLPCIVLVFLLLCLFLCVIFLAACVLLFCFVSYHFVCDAWFLWFGCCCVGSEFSFVIHFDSSLGVVNYCFFSTDLYFLCISLSILGAVVFDGVALLSSFLHVLYCWFGCLIVCLIYISTFLVISLRVDWLLLCYPSFPSSSDVFCCLIIVSMISSWFLDLTFFVFHSGSSFSLVMLRWLCSWSRLILLCCYHLQKYFEGYWRIMIS
jgi:hypothetical protein